VLATQIVERADEAAPTVTVMIAAACPVLTALTEKLQQEVKHSHRFAGVCFGD
jgi:hypothetical protein